MDTATLPTLTTLTTDTGYALSGLREMETHSGVAWSATIKRNGKKVGTVEQSGRGGSNMYFFTSAAEREAFTAKATEIYGTDMTEVEDQFAVDLSMLTSMARKRTVVFFADGDEPGTYHAFRSGVTVEQAKAHLASPRSGYATKNPMVFDKAVGRFVPASV